MEKRLEELEIKVAFQEHLLAQLDEQVRELRQQLAEALSEVLRIREELDLGRITVEDGPPPHW